MTLYTLSRAALLRLAGLSVVALAAGCTRPPPRTFPDIGFTQRGPIVLNVARIAVDQRYRPPMAPPHVEHLFLQVPSEVIRRWADQRLRAAGQSGMATVIIEDARVTEEQLPRTEGVRGLFAIDQAQRYNARLAVRVEATNPALRTGGFALANVERSVTVAEDVSPQGREATWYHLIETAAADLDAQLDRSIREHLAPLVLR